MFPYILNPSFLESCQLTNSSFFTAPSRGILLGGLRTSPEDAYVNYSNSAQSYLPPYALTFATHINSGNALLLGDEDGIIAILNSRTQFRHQMLDGHETPLARFQAHNNAIFDATFLRDDHCVATGAGDGSVRLFSSDGHHRIATLIVSKGSVKCVKPKPNTFDNILGVTTRDGAFRIYDLRIPNPEQRNQVGEPLQPAAVITKKNAHVPNSAPWMRSFIRRNQAGSFRRFTSQPTASVTSMAWLSDNTLLTGGGSDGTIKAWDIRDLNNGAIWDVQPAMEGSRGSPFGIASIDIVDNCLAASCTDSTIYVYNKECMDYGATHLLTGHAQTGFYIKSRLSPCGQFVLSGSSDSMAYIWDLTVPSVRGRVYPIVALEGHEGGEVAPVAWSNVEFGTVATGGDDCNIRLWNTANGSEPLPARNTPIRKNEARTNAARLVQVDLSKTVPVEDARRPNKPKLTETDIRSFFTSSSPNASTHLNAMVGHQCQSQRSGLQA